MHEEQLVARSLTLRYVVALILVGILTSSAWLSLQLVISSQESNAAIVNVSGRQRMLSQRIALFSSLLVNSPPGARAEIRDKLRQAVDLMRTSHQGLTQGNPAMGLPAEMTETVRAMYHEPPLAVDSQVKDYLAHVEALLNTPEEYLQRQNEHLQAIIATGPARLVASLDKVVNQYQAEGETAVRRLYKGETVVWITTLLLLLLEALFIFRPISRQIRHVIGKLEELTESLRQSKDELEHRVQERTAELDQIAHYDPLTGIPNRRRLFEVLNQAIARADRQQTGLAVCYMDLDGFKPVNDNYGHNLGDSLLVEVASRLKQVLRAENTVARLGGDEFILLLGDIKQKDEIAVVLNRVLDVIRKDFQLGRLTVKISASIGVTLYPDDAVDSDTLIRHSDQAMYLAKEAGKNCYLFFDPEHDRQLQIRRDQVQRLALALERREFVLYYQPKVNMRSGRVIGVEALIRWQHPERGVLPPAEFLSLISNEPLAIQLGEWVLDTAMTQIEVWKAIGLALPVSVNIDAIHIEQPDFVERLGKILAQHPNVRSGDLELEVLETNALADIGWVSDVIAACRKLGIGFALDDFGTGYSSLLYLKRLPADTLKIDQGFIRDMLDDPEDLAILEGVLGLSVAFQRRAIAEGVETEAHGAMLLRMNCENAQGYAISRPMPASEVQYWLAYWQRYPSWVVTRNCRREDLPVLFALTEHRAWVAQLVKYLQGSGSSLPQLDASKCRFGKWLAGEAQRAYADSPGFREILALHEGAHELGKQLIQEKQQGAVEPAGIDRLIGYRDRLNDLLMALLGEAPAHPPQA